MDRRTGDVVAIKKIFDAFRDQTDAQVGEQGGSLGRCGELWEGPGTASFLAFLFLTENLQGSHASPGKRPRPSCRFPSLGASPHRQGRSWPYWPRAQPWPHSSNSLSSQEFGDHPNIIRLLDVIPAENDKDIYLVFESMGE